MRILLGTLILLSLFTAAALWQRSWTSQARSGRERFRTSAEHGAPGAAGDGWSRVVLGRPSGGEPYPGAGETAIDTSPARDPEVASGISPGVGPANPTPADPRSREASTGPSNPAQDTVVTVQAGQTLWELCRDHYGAAPQELVLAVARHNRLAGPDEILEGQEIRLPPTEKILPKR